MNKIYKINLNNIPKFNFEDRDNDEEIKNTFKQNNIDLFEKAKNGFKNLYVNINNEYYKFEQVDINKHLYFCEGCDYLNKCFEKLPICISSALFGKEAKIGLKKIEMYEAVFNGD